MYWVILSVGLALWVLAHLFKRIAPGTRQGLGDTGKGLVALAILASIVLTVIGYRNTAFVMIWSPPAFLTHINNLLMLVAIFLMSPAAKKGRLISGMRHPMLTGFAFWAGAHLLVNGDLTAIITFGTFLVWAIVAAQIINRSEPSWTRPEGGTYAKDAMFALGCVVIFIGIAVMHNWLGVWPFE